MSKPSFDIARAMSSSAESENTLSVHELRDKLVLRWPLLVVCLVVLPVVAALLTALVPLTFKGTAQVLIRHESSSLNVLDSRGRGTTDASGPASAELIQSIPVISRMVEAVGAEDSDVARPAYKVLSRYAFRLIAPLLPKEKEEGPAKPELVRAMLASEFKPSIKVTTLQTELRTIGKQDELLEVTLSSTNPRKVAEMTNALCTAFIKEHNLRSEAEAIRTSEILAQAEQKTREQIRELLDQPLDLTGHAATVGQSERAAHSQPLTDSLAHHLADLELALIETRRSYGDNSDELQKARQTLDQARAVYARQEALDGLNAVLANLKDQQREVFLILELARKNQTGLSVAEEALPPRVTSVVKLMHYGIPVGVSIFLGGVLGLGLIVLASTFDNKVRSRWEIERITGLPITGTLETGRTQQGANGTAPVSPVIEKLLGSLGAAPTDGCRVVAVISPNGTEDVSALSRQLAKSLAQDSRNRVLLVDGNLGQRTLTESLGQGDAPGLAELLADPGQAPARLIKQKSGEPAFLPAGNAATAQHLALVNQPWSVILEALKKQADFIIIDAGGLGLGRTTRIFLQTADVHLVGAVIGVTEVASFAAVHRELAPLAGRSLGTVLVSR